jgi:hypothetical protein
MEGATWRGRFAAVLLPVEYTFDGWNPCAEAEVPIDYVGRIDIDTLPSIEAFFIGDSTHATLKFSGQSVSDDGYSTQDQYCAARVAFSPEGDPPHVVVNEVENIIFNGSDGGKYKVSLRFHRTVVDGELQTEMGSFDARCTRVVQLSVPISGRC